MNYCKECKGELNDKYVICEKCFNNFNKSHSKICMVRRIKLPKPPRNN